MFEELNLSQEQLEGVQKVLQSETDKVRTEYTKKIKELEVKLPQEQTEEEKAYAERLKALEDREKELDHKEKLQSVQAKLKDKGLDEQLAKYINFQGVEDIETYLTEFTDLFNVGGEGYKPKAHDGSVMMTKEQFNKMNYVERMNLYNTNKTLYDTLSK